MIFFIDTANINEIEEASKWGIIAGVTTNPSLIAKEGRDLKEVIAKIATLIDGPISAEVTEDTPENMFKEAQELAALHPNIVIKVPMTEEGIIVTKMLSKINVKVNVTLIFSVSQALLASNAGARFISPFLGRMDDAYGENKGVELLEDIVSAISLTGNKTSIIAASIRNTKHVEDSALAGSDIATIPFKVLKEMFKHPLTDKGLEIFRQSQK